VALPNRWKPSEKPSDSAEASASKSVALPESHLTVPHTLEAKDATKKIDLASALQYGTAQGYPPLFSFIKEFTTKYLHPTIPYQDGADIILTCGSTDGFFKTVQCFNNEWSEGKDPVEEREGILVECFAYMGAVGTANSRGMNIAPVAIDAQGMLASGPGGLEDILVNWDFRKGKRPHLLYTVT
jgi:DNA-binding transcriptional MocR family regulator